MLGYLDIFQYIFILTLEIFARFQGRIYSILMVLRNIVENNIRTLHRSQIPVPRIEKSTMKITKTKKKTRIRIESMK